MKKLLFPVAIAALLFTACVEEEHEVEMTEAEMQAQTDSIVGTKLDELNDEANDDLERRMAIEVKPKADSIVEAKMAE